MREEVENDETILLMARDRAQELIQNYIDELGKLSDVEYEVIWIYE